MTATRSKPKIFEVFRSQNLLARAVVGMSPDRCVVTFSPLEDDYSLARPGFGEGFFRERRIDAIHVIPNGNDWYQYADLEKLCSCVAAETARYRHVTAYGSSMGGYAAIRYGQWVGAHLAFALSPQYTANPRRPPFDRRWQERGRKIRFLHENKRGAVRRAIVVYDPLDKDAEHVRLIRNITEVVAVELPNSGHPCTGFLADLGVLQSAALDVCLERFDVEPFIRDVMPRSETAPQFHIVRSQRTLDPDARFQLATQAAEKAPTHAATLLELAVASIEAGKPAAAIDALDRVDAIEKGGVLAHFLRARAYEKANRIDEAIAIMETLCKPGTDSSYYRGMLARLKRRRALAAWLRPLAPWTSRLLRMRTPD
jgi:hypothetical protein